MKTLNTILRIPLLLLILYVGSFTAYGVILAIQKDGFLNLNWKFYAYALEGALEVAVLVWIYRWLERPAAGETPLNKTTGT